MIFQYSLDKQQIILVFSHFYLIYEFEEQELNDELLELSEECEIMAAIKTSTKIAPNTIPTIHHIFYY